MFSAEQENAIKLKAGAWENAGVVELTVSPTIDKTAFVFYSASVTTGGGVSIHFRVTLDEIEVKPCRSSTLNSDRASTAVG